MTKRFADRIYQTSVTTGTGPYQFGPVMPGGYLAFSAVPGIQDGDTVDAYVDQQDSAQFEVGTYTYRSGGTLERTSIIRSSNGTAPVDWQAGTRRIGLTITAARIAAIDGLLSAPVTPVTVSGGLAVIDCSLGDYFTLALTANATLSVINPPPQGGSKMLRINQDPATPRTLAWPASFRWEGGAPTVSAVVSAVDLLGFSTLDGGAKWDASLSKGRA